MPTPYWNLPGGKQADIGKQVDFFVLVWSDPYPRRHGVQRGSHVSRRPDRFAGKILRTSNA